MNGGSQLEGAGLLYFGFGLLGLDPPTLGGGFSRPRR